tara:strand:- start:286 stop:486 length:201 start_codon:yes stop_codon:yes gene_type:complete
MMNNQNAPINDVIDPMANVANNVSVFPQAVQTNAERMYGTVQNRRDSMPGAMDERNNYEENLTQAI